MAERVARSSADLDACPARHCWVVDSLDGVKRAALLLEWRRAAVCTGWEGRVVYLAKLAEWGRLDRRPGVGAGGLPDHGVTWRSRLRRRRSQGPADLEPDDPPVFDRNGPNLSTVACEGSSHQ